MAQARRNKGKGKKTFSRQEQRSRAAAAMLLFLCTVFLAFNSLLGDKSLFHLHKMELEREKWIRENARQARENLDLKAKILAAREDLSVVEKIAREELGLVRKNEVVYLFGPAGIRDGDAVAPGTRPAPRHPEENP